MPDELQPTRLFDWLTVERCHQNREALLSAELDFLESEPAADLLEAFGRFLVTHTSRRCFARSIMLGTKNKDPGLWSFAETNPHVDPESRLGHELALEEYVSAYVGIHDPHAVSAREPIGIFLRPDLEAEPKHAHIMFRDIRSYCPFPTGVPFCELTADQKCCKTIRVADAAAVLAQEIMRKRDGNVWAYWGDPSSIEFQRLFVRGGSEWSDKLVYHKFQHIDPREFVAILYPSRLYDHHDSRELSREAITDPLALALSSAFGDRLLIYEYRERPREQFVRASRAVARYVDKFGELPISVETAIAEVGL